MTSYFWPDDPEIEVTPFECDRAYLYGRELVPIKLPEEHFIQLKLEVRRKGHNTNSQYNHSPSFRGDEGYIWSNFIIFESNGLRFTSLP